MDQASTVAAIADGTVRRRLVPQLVRHAPLLAFAAATVATSLAIKAAFVGSIQLDLVMLAIGLVLFWPMLLPALIPMLFFRVAVFEKPESPARALFASVRPYLAADGRLLPGVLMLLAISVFMAGFASLKASITFIQPFAWDQAFDEWDRILHFGYRPWELLQPILGYGPVTAFISINYNFWFLTLTMYWLHFAFAERPGVLRTQAVAAFMLTWSVGGVLLAIVFSSAGPCFYSLLGLAPDPYAGLMTYLRTTAESWPVWALGLQDALWANFASNGVADATKGISAMPSMHNAQCLLLVLAVWNKAPIIRNLAIGHGVLVFLGSIHLGWHYAVDAYLAFVIAGIAWIAAGWFARRWEKATA